MIKLSNEYAQDVLGWQGYAHWLHIYCAIRGEFVEGWIPYNYYTKIVVPKLKGNYGSIAQLKTLNKVLFNSSHFPDIMYFTNQLWFDRNYLVISKKLLLEEIKKYDKVIFKADNSSQGRAISVYNVDNFDISLAERAGNGVLQEYINQHSFFAEFMSDNVATIRFTTAIDEKGNVSLRACYLRIGRRADTHVRSKSQIRVSVDPKNGALDSIGYKDNWTETEEHPDTHTKFKNKVIPNFEKCVNTVLDLHKKIPFARIIGWDVITDENNQVKIMEWNGENNAITFSEATKGPIFKGLGYENLWKSK